MEKVTVPLFAREPVAKATPAIICRDGQRDPAEIQADKFAALLLMRATDVRAAAKLVQGEPLAIDNLVARKKAGEQISELRSLAAEIIAEDKYPPLTRCWRELEELFMNDPMLDDGVFVQSWILMDFPFGPERRTALDHFEAFLQGIPETSACSVAVRWDR